jgi:hypothetical protein
VYAADAAAFRPDVDVVRRLPICYAAGYWDVSATSARPDGRLPRRSFWHVRPLFVFVDSKFGCLHFPSWQT